MCARFTLTIADYEELARRLLARVEPELAREYGPRYNVAPSEHHWILGSRGGERRLARARWGLVAAWQRDPAQGARQINARRETVHRRRAYRDAFVRRRCVVPADGFFEWSGPKGRRRPIWFHRPDGQLLLMAGLFERYADPRAGEIPTFTILTTAAGGEVADVHDRMPVILPPEGIDPWIHNPGADQPADPDELSDFLAALPHVPLTGRAVSRRVNRPGVDDPACLEAEPETPTSDPHRQGSLF